MIADLYDDPSKTAKKDDAARIVIDRYERAKRENDKRKPKYEDWYAAYRSYHKADSASPFRSKLFIPTTFEHLESHLPRLAAARPRIEVHGRGPEDAAKAQAQRVLLYFYWDSLRMDMKLVDFAKSALIFGISWWKVEWRRRTRVVKKMVEQQVPGLELFGQVMSTRTEMVEVEQEIREIDSPTVTLKDPGDIYFDEDGYSEDTADWIIEKEKMSLADLENAVDIDKKPLYDPAVLAELKELSKSGNQVDSAPDDEDQRQNILSAASDSTTADPYKRQFTILTEWTDSHRRAVVKEHMDLPPILNKENPYRMKPFVRYTPIPLPNEMIGVSMAEALYSIQYSQNLLNNARMDHVMQTVHGMHTVRRASGLQPSQLRFRPGGGIIVRQHDDIRPFEHARLDFTHYREAEFLDGLAQKTSGSTDIYRGIGSSSGGTATESSILAQSSSSRVGLMFQILSAQSLHRLGKLWIRMNELHLDEARRVRITGPEIASALVNEQGQPPTHFEVTPEELSSGGEEELDLVIDVSQTEPGTQQFKLQRAQQLLQTLGPIVAPGGPVMMEAIRGALEGLSVPNPDKVLAAEQAYIQQQQQAALAAQNPPGGGASDAQNLAINASADAPQGA